MNVKVAFVSCSGELADRFIQRIAGLSPELEFYVISEFPPAQGRWIPYHVGRSFHENFALCRAVLAGKRIRLTAVVLVPNAPYRLMQLMPLLLAPLRTLFFNENLDHFVLRPRSVPGIARHFGWRCRNLIRYQLHPGGDVYTFFWRLRHPANFRRPVFFEAGRIAGVMTAVLKALLPVRREPRKSALPPPGISIVIPSRNGRDLLNTLLPGLLRELEGLRSEIIVVDNGSDDSTAACLRGTDPEIVIEESTEPLSFARAVNRGIRRARYSHVLLLNNDMELHPGFFAPLVRAFEQIPDLFCATAQIFFPDRQRREETGKAVMSPLQRERKETDFPVYCAVPIEGEDLSWVLYGSGGCSLFDTSKARLLGGLGEIYEPAYVEDLDFGVRAWQRGWPTVFAARAKVTHRHRTTTSRYYSQQELDRVLEINYLKFLARCVSSPALFRRMWSDALTRLNLQCSIHGHSPSLDALVQAWRAPVWIERAPADIASEELLFALGSGEVAVFPGNARRGLPVVAVASPYVPFPLSHGGAVRMYNLMRRATTEYSQVLVTFVDEFHTPPPELLEICIEIVEVRRRGSHWKPSTQRPDVVEEFDTAPFHAALRQTLRKWNPSVVQLEFTQMAAYAKDCALMKTILVEHDITLDLYQQMLAQEEDWETRRQLERWVRFESAAWRQADCVVVMSEKDRMTVKAAKRCVSIPNGVDLDRYRPAPVEPEALRLLFIGSFAHLPNLFAMEFFQNEVWPLLAGLTPALHVIAGSHYLYYYNLHKDRLRLDLEQPGLEVEGFVPDVRPAYERAAIVIAPLRASAGTNIKIMEAMAMGKAIVSTRAGVNGLAVEPGRDMVVAGNGAEMAAAILDLLGNPAKRRCLERHARASAEQYDWDVIARQQSELYRELTADGR